MNSYLKGFLAVALAIVSASALAQGADVTAGVMEQFQAATMAINQKLIKPGIATACVAVTLQWIFTYWRELFTGEPTSWLAKGVLIMSWFGGTLALLFHMDVLTTAFTSYIKLSGSLSGVSPADFSPGALIEKSVTMIDATNKAFKEGSGANWFAVADNIGAALMLTFANVFTFLAFLMIALSLFVAQLEFWVLFSVAPLAFGMIPLSAFRDQGLAPIKGVISLGLRLIILGVIVSVTSALTETVIGLLQQALPAFRPVWYYLAGMAGCAMMSISAGKIAASIASGSASFSGADAVRGGMQLATTAGAAAAGVAGVAALGMAGARPAIEGLKAGAQAVGKMADMWNGRPGAGRAGLSGLGGSPIQQRPSLENGNSTKSGPGGTSPGGGKPQPAPGGGNEPSALEKMLEGAGQDSHQVGIQMHVSKD